MASITQNKKDGKVVSLQIQVLRGAGRTGKASVQVQHLESPGRSDSVKGRKGSTDTSGVISALA